MSKKITQEMWCFHCEHGWVTDDYHNCIACPNCKTIPVRIYRTSSTAFVYAYLEKHPEKMPKECSMIIGIDPGVKVGFAAWNRHKKQFLTVDTCKMHTVLIRIKNAWDNHDIHMVYIEDPNTYIPFRDVPSSKQTAKLQGAGSVKRSFSVIAEMLDEYKIPYTKTRLQKGLKKTTAKFFKQQTGWQGTTDEHGRDAAFLVWQR